MEKDTLHLWGYIKKDGIFGSGGHAKKGNLLQEKAKKVKKLTFRIPLE